MRRRQRRRLLHPSSTTLVISSSPPAWKHLAEITYASHKAWADAKGYDYYGDVSDLMDNYYNWHTKTMERRGIAGFVKFDLFLHFLPKYSRVIWLDADLVVTNPKYLVLDLQETCADGHKDVLLPYDFNGINATVIIIESTPETMAFAWAVNNTARKFFLGHDWKEMEGMRYFQMTPPHDRLISWTSAKDLCALHPGAYLPYVPEIVTKPYEWEPGCFSIHLSALPLDRRIELAREYAAK